jgi:hypothetical protein
MSASLAYAAATAGESKQQRTPPPLPPRCPCPDVPTPPLGAPCRTMRHSWLMCKGCCTTAQGKARLTTSGSYWMSGPSGGSILHAPMAMLAGLMSTKPNNTTTNQQQWRQRQQGGGGRGGGEGGGGGHIQQRCR